MHCRLTKPRLAWKQWAEAGAAGGPARQRDHGQGETRVNERQAVGDNFDRDVLCGRHAGVRRNIRWRRKAPGTSLRARPAPTPSSPTRAASSASSRRRARGRSMSAPPASALSPSTPRSACRGPPRRLPFGNGDRLQEGPARPRHPPRPRGRSGDPPLHPGPGPDSTIVGEEDGAEGTGRVAWYVDPIDGTANFARGLASWCVSVGAVIGDEIVAGAIVGPLGGNVFSADRGGAWLKGPPLRSRAVEDERRAALITATRSRTPPRRPRTGARRLRHPRRDLLASAAPAAPRSPSPRWPRAGPTPPAASASTPGT